MHSTPFLPYIVIILTAAVFIVALFKRLKLSPVLGYFAAGAAIGGQGLAIVTAEETSSFAEFGIVFLLFAIGLELTFERLKAMRNYVFGFGSLQVVISMVAIATILYFLGLSGNAAIIVGSGLALSSSAVVLQVLAEERRQSTQVGRLSLATLLLQDFTVVPILVLVPLLAGEKTNIVSALGIAMGKAVIALLLIFLAGRVFLRPLFGIIGIAPSGKTNEISIATTLLIALGAAWVTENWGLSLALGAFVAGVLVAETEFQHQVEECIAPFKGLFLGLFFMTVGMSINITLILDKLPLIIAFSLLLLVVKSLIIIVLSRLFRFSIATSVHAGLLLAQGGEFAFILFRLAYEKQIIDREVSQISMLIVTVTMALTPLLSLIGKHIADWLEQKEADEPAMVARDVADLDNHVIIAGFGRVGKMVGKLLEAEHIRYVAVEADNQVVREAEIEGFPVYNGDAGSLEMLRNLGIERAQSVIITIENEVVLLGTAQIIHSHYPQLPIVVRAKDLHNAEVLKAAGATIIVPETYETGLQLGGAVLRSVGVGEYEISRIKNQFRAGNYVWAQFVDDPFEEKATTVMPDE